MASSEIHVSFHISIGIFRERKNEWFAMEIWGFLTNHASNKECNRQPCVNHALIIFQQQKEPMSRNIHIKEIHIWQVCWSSFQQMKLHIHINVLTLLLQIIIAFNGYYQAYLAIFMFYTKEAKTQNKRFIINQMELRHFLTVCMHDITFH